MRGQATKKERSEKVGWKGGIIYSEASVCDNPYHRHHEVTDGACGGASHLDVCEEVQGLQDPHVGAGGDAAAPHGSTQPL